MVAAMCDAVWTAAVCNKQEFSRLQQLNIEDSTVSR
jgi:hypothetical protein